MKEPIIKGRRVLFNCCSFCGWPIEQSIDLDNDGDEVSCSFCEQPLIVRKWSQEAEVSPIQEMAISMPVFVGNA